MSGKLSIILFRRDLRICDNPALFHAMRTGDPVAALYIYDETAPDAPGAAGRWWLKHSLGELRKDLSELGVPLIVCAGDRRRKTVEIAGELRASNIFWNRQFFADLNAVDKAIAEDLRSQGIKTHIFNGSLLREPWEIKNKKGEPYRVFTPFWRELRNMGPNRLTPLPAPAPRNCNSPTHNLGQSIAEVLAGSEGLDFSGIWDPGELAAAARLGKFLESEIATYDINRDRPDLNATSRISPYLAFGEISPVQIWSAVTMKTTTDASYLSGAGKFLSELAWREFSYSLLHYNNKLVDEPLRPGFLAYPWRTDEQRFAAWTAGRTGYPIVDAGMRQLRQTGWMHNRVRMIAASFLIKDIGVSWTDGAKWFAERLLDADLANNSASWQWVAGCGTDAAPFFRISNPISQSRKFDPDGSYIRQFVPELANLSTDHIHAPWSAPASVLEKAGVVLGKTYKKPILDHSVARKRALAGYDVVKTTVHA